MAGKFSIITLTLVVLSVIGILAIYLKKNYNDSDEAIIGDYVKKQNVNRIQYDSNTLVFTSTSNETALIFYPGANVEYNAYEPLMAACAKRGIMTILVKMPFNLASLDFNWANKVRKNF